MLDAVETQLHSVYISTNTMHIRTGDNILQRRRKEELQLRLKKLFCLW